MQLTERHFIHKGSEQSMECERVHRGLFRASDGRLINADVNGALNILRKCKPEAFTDGVVGVVVHQKTSQGSHGVFSSVEELRLV